MTHVVEPAATARLPTVTGQVVSTGERPVFLAGVAVSLIGAEATYRDTTDEMGRFRFGGVAQGRYRLRAAKAGYVTTEFGALQAGGDGSFVTLAERDEVELSIVLPRAASVSGTVRGPDGAPAPDVLVTITSNAGRSDLVWTDRRGEYRFHSLLPGDTSCQPGREAVWSDSSTRL